MKIKKNAIWLLLDSRYPGGIESHVLQLAKGLQDHNKDVLVVFINNYGLHPLKVRLVKDGIATYSLDGRITSLWKMVKRLKPSIIHTHGYKAGILGRVVGMMSRTDIVSTYHAGELPSGKMKLYDWIDRHTSHLASKVFAVSPQIAQRLPVNAKLVDNFVDVSNLEISNGKQIAFVGRLSIEKGPDYFLKLANVFPNTMFHIYGGGPIENKLKLSASDNICFHGQQDTMEYVWPKIGLLVIPSRHEGLPMAALEAMARGIPVLASDVGALDQLIDPGCNGWLVTAGNNDEFSRCLKIWIDMSDEKKQLFKQLAKHKILERFSSEIAIPELIESYCQLAS